jgi:hypothetical protein
MIVDSPAGKVAGKNLVEMMIRLGWTCDRKVAPWLSFSRTMGNHYIYVGKVASGWQHKWMRGPSWTITESGSFGTVAACLRDLWERVVINQDHYELTMSENHKLRTEAPVGDGEETLQEAMDAWEANLPKNKDWSCPVCGVTWKVAVDCEEPRCIRCVPVTPDEI